MPDKYFAKPEELERIIDLQEFDLDYASLNDTFSDLVKLAAKVAGTEVSLLNLIDMYTQWTVTGHGFPSGQTPRENSVCQFTIMEPEHFEVKDLSQDERFRDFQGIKDGPKLRYYFGVPLKTKDGQSIGTLCVLDTTTKHLDPSKIELLKIIANQILERLLEQKQLKVLHNELAEACEHTKRLAHDIRGPIGGIVGLAKLLMRKSEAYKLEDIYTLSQHICQSGTSLIDLTDEILDTGKTNVSATLNLKSLVLTLPQFKERLEKLYQPQATDKGIRFIVSIDQKQGNIPFPKNKLMQITGNLISNAFKFTPPFGEVSVKLELNMEPNFRILHIVVSDNGIGISQEQIANVMYGNSFTTHGTAGEQGFGLGLQLVKHLLSGLHGTMDVTSVQGKGTRFELKIPVGSVMPLPINPLS